MRIGRRRGAGVLTLAAAMALSLIGSADVRAASITDVESSARIIAPLTISIEGSGVLAFGDFITTNNGIAQVNINPQTGARSQTGGITLAGGEVSNLVLKDAYDLPMG